MRLSQLRKIIEQQMAGGKDWRTVHSFLIANISAARAPGSSFVSGNSIVSATLDGNASASMLLDERATETRFIAAAFSDDNTAGVAVDLRLHQAVPVGGKTLPSVAADPEVICELNLPALGTNNVVFERGEPGAALTPSLCLTEIEVRTPGGGAWPSGGAVYLIGQLQVR